MALEMGPVSAAQYTWFVGELNNKHLEVVPISAEQAYIVCERAKQCGLRNGSYLSRANIPGLRES